jgi:paraquat-inducible protein B
VTNVQLQFDPKDVSFLIPVYVEIDLNKVKVIGDGPSGEQLSRLIEKGLRAQLELQSMVTGQLMINLDFFPGKPVKLVKLDTRYGELPTIPSDLDQFLKLASDLPLKDLVDKLMGSLQGIDRAVNSPKLASSIESLSEGLMEAKTILKKIDAQIEPIIGNFKDSSASLKELLAKTQGVPQKVDQTLAATETTLRQAEKTLLSVQGIASDNSSLVLEVDNTLREVGRTARSVRSLTDYLQRYPEAVLKGKQPAKGE